jgi:hypothetical protein
MNNQLSNTGSGEPLVSTLGPVEMCTQSFFKELLFNSNRLLYSDMYNMERYCTSLYCIENLYWRDSAGVESNTRYNKNTHYNKKFMLNF